MNRHVTGFPPLVLGLPQLVIFGSMPSVRSLELGEYYGHPRNHFWPLIFSLCGLPYPDRPDYAEKKALLRRSGVGLWDILAVCTRRGSSDQTIREELPQDIAGFLRRWPSIQAVAFNGAKARDSFDRFFSRDQFPQIDFLELPSSSPIPTKKTRTFADKLQYWQILRPYLAFPGASGKFRSGS